MLRSLKNIIKWVNVIIDIRTFLLSQEQQILFLKFQLKFVLQFYQLHKNEEHYRRGIPFLCVY